ncbi:unnamed protein product [Phytophthora fragariaefolia]|uniref:Unnamed protein product n=1 Tax=Phytophthora fragariaefolia TaxID=1490495 RepID=A0A9W6TVZ6_9STRA|nr:unnamed protein product [Phytophthora fragariaefolia]
MAAVAATKPKTLTHFKALSVQEDEFQLDNLSFWQQSVEPVVLTPTLHEFWKGFGEFPPHYFVREVIVVPWEMLKRLIWCTTMGGGQSKSQVDRLRRHYITDCNEEENYYNRKWWKLTVDSGYVLSTLGRMVGMDKQLEVYKYAKSVGTGFHGVAYELLLQNAVHRAFAKRKPIVLKVREGSKYERIEIRGPNFVCRGEDEASCYPCLSTLDKDTYWRPNYAFFPFIDAVTTCEAFQSGSEDSETIVAYVQVTIRSEKTFKEDRLRLLNEEMDKNQSLKDMKRAFVVVGPDPSVCEGFILHDEPDPDTFLAMVSCFSPEQLEPEVS